MTNTANPSDRQTNWLAAGSSIYCPGPAAATDHTPVDSVVLPAPSGLWGLSVQHYPLVGITVVVVDGELDLLTAPLVEQCLRDQLVAEPAHLVLDLESVHFLGASGLSCLLGARELVGARGSQLHLAGLITSVVQRAVEATGLLGVFSTYPSLFHAVIDLATRPEVTTSDRGIPPSVLTAQADHEGAGVSTLSESSGSTEREYAHLLPLQRRYAELGVDNPERQQLRELLISGYLPVAEHIARRFAGRGEPLEDLIQVATVGLINAVDRFDPARGSEFLSFAVPTITGGLRRYFRDYGWSTRVPRRIKDCALAIKRAQEQLSQQLGRSPRPSEIADRLGVPLSQVIEALCAAEAYRSASLDDMCSSGSAATIHNKFVGNLDAEISLIDDREALRPLLAELTARERTILALRFFHQLTQAEIAEHVGISQMHVSRLLRRTLNFLHERMVSSD